MSAFPELTFHDPPGDSAETRTTPHTPSSTTGGHPTSSTSPTSTSSASPTSTSSAFPAASGDASNTLATVALAVGGIAVLALLLVAIVVGLRRCRRHRRPHPHTDVHTTDNGVFSPYGGGPAPPNDAPNRYASPQPIGPALRTYEIPVVNQHTDMPPNSFAANPSAATIYDNADPSTASTPFVPATDSSADTAVTPTTDNPTDTPFAPAAANTADQATRPRDAAQQAVRNRGAHLTSAYGSAVALASTTSMVMMATVALLAMATLMAAPARARLAPDLNWVPTENGDLVAPTKHLYVEGIPLVSYIANTRYVVVANNTNDCKVDIRVFIVWPEKDGDGPDKRLQILGDYSFSAPSGGNRTVLFMRSNEPTTLYAFDNYDPLAVEGGRCVDLDRCMCIGCTPQDEKDKITAPVRKINILTGNQEQTTITQVTDEGHRCSSFAILTQDTAEDVTRLMWGTTEPFKLHLGTKDPYSGLVPDPNPNLFPNSIYACAAHNTRGVMFLDRGSNNHVYGSQTAISSIKRAHPFRTGAEDPSFERLNNTFSVTCETTYLDPATNVVSLYTSANESRTIHFPQRILDAIAASNHSFLSL